MQDPRMITTVLHAWNAAIVRLDKLLLSLPGGDLSREIAPGRNRVLYIVGHLAAHHDRLFPLLRLGERAQPELDLPFITTPDRKDQQPSGLYSAASILDAWELINRRLTEHMASLTPEEWLERHNDVSPEDFALDPVRNRLAVLISRTNHVSYHTGQIQLAR